MYTAARRRGLASLRRLHTSLTHPSQTHSVVTNSVPEPTGSRPPRANAVLGTTSLTTSPSARMGEPSAFLSRTATRTWHSQQPDTSRARNKGAFHHRGRTMYWRESCCRLRPFEMVWCGECVASALRCRVTAAVVAVQDDAVARKIRPIQAALEEHAYRTAVKLSLKKDVHMLPLAKVPLRRACRWCFCLAHIMTLCVCSRARAQAMRALALARLEQGDEASAIVNELLVGIPLLPVPTGRAGSGDERALVWVLFAAPQAD